MTPEALVAEVTALASIPDIAVQINDLLEDPNSSAWDIGRLIESDPGLSAALLRIANSALYNNGIPITEVDRAVTMVGTREVRDLALGVCAMEAFDGISNELITMQDFWFHSLYCAAAARVISRAAGQRGQGSAFIAGLLHDIGQLVMFILRPRESAAALSLSVDRDDGRSTFGAEREVFGFDHTEVGDALAREWGLPNVVRQAIRFHHTPFAGLDDDEAMRGEEARLRATVHLANTIAVLGEIRSTHLSDGPTLAPRTLEILGIDEAQIPTLIEQSGESVGELLRAFAPAMAA